MFGTLDNLYSHTRMLGVSDCGSSPSSCKRGFPAGDPENTAEKWTWPTKAKDSDYF